MMNGQEQLGDSASVLRDVISFFSRIVSSAEDGEFDIQAEIRKIEEQTVHIAQVRLLFAFAVLSV